MKEIAKLSASEIADALGRTTRAIEIRAAKEGWVYSVVKGPRGERRVYHVMPLPGDVREAVIAFMTLQAQLAGPPPAAANDATGVAPTGSLAVTVPTSLPALPAHQLRDWQRRCMEARAALMVELRKLAGMEGLNAAVRRLVATAAAGTMRADLLALVPSANARSGGDGERTLSERTLKRWWSLWKNASFDAAVLAPKDGGSEPSVPDWAPAFLAAYRVPSNPGVPEAIERMRLPEGVAKPSEDQARRFIAKLSPVERERGRKSPAALRALKPFVRRDTGELLPLDVVVCDGHTGKLDWQHPIHGKQFRPELTAVIDAATRRAVGWSALFSESTWAVMDAYCHMFRTVGLPAIAYSDNGSGQTAKFIADPVTGLLGRLGITHELGRPGNPQGRGLIERAWEKLFIQPAKALPSYAGRDMDQDSRKRVVKLTERQLKAGPTSALLPTWDEGLAWAAAAVARYNAAPHRGLPKIRDPQTGKMRHESPDEAWQRFVGAGWEPVRLNPAEAADLFRPHIGRRVRRCEIELFGNRYFSAALADHHGEDVQVGFDIHDGNRVWVRNAEGVLLAIAEADGNARPYFEKDKLDSAKGKLKRLDEKRQTVLAGVGQGVLEHQPAGPVLDLQAAEREYARLEEAPPAPPAEAQGGAQAGGRPVFRDVESWGRWVLDPAHADRLTDLDRELLAKRLRDPSFRLLMDLDEQDSAAAG